MFIGNHKAICQGQKDEAFAKIPATQLAENKIDAEEERTDSERYFLSGESNTDGNQEKLDLFNSFELRNSKTTLEVNKENQPTLKQTIDYANLSVPEVFVEDDEVESDIDDEGFEPNHFLVHEKMMKNSPGKLDHPEGHKKATSCPKEVDSSQTVEIFDSDEENDKVKREGDSNTSDEKYTVKEDLLGPLTIKKKKDIKDPQILFQKGTCLEEVIDVEMFNEADSDELTMPTPFLSGRTTDGDPIFVDLQAR